ncbi:hypothetical protein CKA32_004813 [Geitlerinema sp. FC II]|nr:hypothetical protein CKA32_004813 [Geitlerinema sp. FC II]
MPGILYEKDRSRILLPNSNVLEIFKRSMRIGALYFKFKTTQIVEFKR